jgi:hypothetical protein
VSANYLASARFENCTASIRIVLMKHDGRWMIHGFHVDPAPGKRAGRGT